MATLKSLKLGVEYYQKANNGNLPEDFAELNEAVDISGIYYKQIDGSRGKWEFGEIFIETTGTPQRIPLIYGPPEKSKEGVSLILFSDLTIGWESMSEVDPDVRPPSG